jgi:hypothetical protein
MSKTLMGVVCAGVLAVGCSGGQKTAAPAATAAGGALTVAAGDFGVPECDSYMKKYIACIDAKVPEMMRAPLKQAFDQQKAAWKQAAATPEGRAGLAMGCTQAEAATKQSMSTYGCQW